MEEMNNAKANFIIVSEYFKSRGILLDADNPSHRVLLRRNLRAAKELLECAGGDLTKATEAVHRVARWAKSKRLSYSLETVTKRWLDDNTPEQRPYVIYNGRKVELRNIDGVWKMRENGRWYNYSGSKKDIKYE